MSDDPWKIFKADPSRQETLKILWPDLYDCLAELDEAGPARVLRCVLGAHPTGQGPPAAGRIVDQWGAPACGPCIERVHGKGHEGWPLKRETARQKAMRR
jgi:hypothetical protein